MRSMRASRGHERPRRWRGRPGQMRPPLPAPRPPEEPAEAALSSRVVDTFFGSLAHRLGLPAGANLVFGDRVEHDGMVVIPVAKAAWGIGGGIDGAKDSGGGGGGASVTPFGYVQIGDGDARFHRIFSPLNAAAVIVAGTVGTALMLRALGRLLTAFRAGQARN
jgi:Sporulation protein YtfJ (Spore_YtfJ)